MQTILRLVFFLVPNSVRQRMKAVLPDRAARALAGTIAKSTPLPSEPHLPKTQAAQKPPQVEVARQLFDASWYIGRYPDAPTEHDDAYRSYLETGMKSGHHPNQSFENIRFPNRANIPAEHLYRVTASPVMCRVPSTRYLKPYQTKKRLNKPYVTFDEYLCRAVVAPNSVGTELSEQDLRIVAYMDSTKRKLTADFSAHLQDTLISIILPTRDRIESLGNAIASVMMQSYENWELIVVSNASGSDAAEVMVRQFADERLKYVRADEHAGTGLVRNLGIKNSSGGIIAHLDDDTQWDPDFLLVLFNQMQSQNAHAIYGAQAIWEGFDPDTRLGRSFKAIRFAPFNRSLLENTDCIPLTTFMHTRVALNEVGWFDTSLERDVGWDLIVRMTETNRPAALPCLLSHSFHGKAEEGALTTNDENASTSGVRSKLVQQSDWVQAFATADGVEHMANSISRKAREARQKKLAKLPVEPVQILIPNYESVHELGMCLRSIVEHTASPYEVLIVDNGSSQETYAELENLSSTFENTRLVKEEENSGFSFAVNRGLAEILDKNQKILILNNDTLVTPDWLDELRYVLFKHSDVGMAVPRQVLPANNPVINPHVPGANKELECDINLSARHNNVIDLQFDPDEGLIELSYAPLFCGLLRPETIRAAGGLDSGNGPHFRSDWILCDFIRRHCNQRIIYTPHSKIYHLQGVATQKKMSSAEGFLGQVHPENPSTRVNDQTQAPAR